MKQHQVVMSAGLMLAALLAGQAQAAPSVATGVALGVATRGSVNASPAVLDGPRASPICLWQVPSKVLYVNLYAVQKILVRPYGDGWSTELTFARNDSMDVPLKPGETVNVHVAQIEKRLAACRGGE